MRARSVFDQKVMNKIRRHHFIHDQLMPNTQGLAVTHDVDVPQHGFDDVEGADVTFLDHVVRPERPPAPSERATIPIHQEAHLP